MIALSSQDKYMLVGDIIEELPDGTTYIGIFKNGTDESGEDNCIIRKISTTKDVLSGITTTKSQYPQGINYDYRYTWIERALYDYQYSKSK